MRDSDAASEIHAGPQDDFGGIHPQPADPWADECSNVVQEVGADLGICLMVTATSRYCRFIRTSLTTHEFVPLMIKHLVAFRGETGRVVSLYLLREYFSTGRALGT